MGNSQDTQKQPRENSEPQQPGDKNVEHGALRDEQLDDVTGAGGGLVIHSPTPSPRTP